MSVPVEKPPYLFNITAGGDKELYNYYNYIQHCMCWSNVHFFAVQ